MTTAVQWVLDTIYSEFPGSYPSDLVRVNRDDSLILDENGNPNLTDPIRSRDIDLTDANVVGASSAPLTTTSPIGFGFNHEVETGVAVRVEGLVDDEWGHLTDSGDFATLVDNVKTALHSQRQYPFDDYHSLFIRESDNQSANHRDYYREGFDIWFVGYDELP